MLGEAKTLTVPNEFIYLPLVLDNLNISLRFWIQSKWAGPKYQNFNSSRKSLRLHLIPATEYFVFEINRDQSFIWGTPKIFGVLCPPTIDVLLHFYYQIFENFRKFGVLCLSIFFEKVPKKFLKFLKLFQNQKKLSFLYPN